MSQISVLTNLDVIECGSCNTWFAIPESMHRKMREEDKYVYCPNGCHIHYYTSDIDKLKKKLSQVEFDLMATRKANERAQSDLSKTKTKLRQVEKRISKGICPCCNRSFIQLQRHIENKHPEYVEGNK